MASPTAWLVIRSQFSRTSIFSLVRVRCIFGAISPAMISTMASKCSLWTLKPVEASPGKPAAAKLCIKIVNKGGLLCRSRAACLTRLLQSQLWSEALWAWEFWDTLDSPCHRSTKHAATCRLAALCPRWSWKAQGDGSVTAFGAYDI